MTKPDLRQLVRAVSEGELLGTDMGVENEMPQQADYYMDPTAPYGQLLPPWASLEVDPNGYRAPLCSVSAADTEYTVVVELPGVSLEDLVVEVTEGEIVVSSERESDEPGPIPGRFHGSLQIPEDVNIEAAGCTLVDGLLTIVLPRAEPPKRRRMKVTATSSRAETRRTAGSRSPSKRKGC